MRKESPAAEVESKNNLGNNKNKLWKYRKVHSSTGKYLVAHFADLTGSEGISYDHIANVTHYDPCGWMLEPVKFLDVFKHF